MSGSPLSFFLGPCKKQIRFTRDATSRENEAAVVRKNNRRFPPHADQSLRSAARSRL